MMKFMRDSMSPGINTLPQISNLNFLFDGFLRSASKQVEDKAGGTSLTPRLVYDKKGNAQATLERLRKTHSQRRQVDFVERGDSILFSERDGCGGGARCGGGDFDLCGQAQVLNIYLLPGEEIELSTLGFPLQKHDLVWARLQIELAHMHLTIELDGSLGPLLARDFLVNFRPLRIHVLPRLTRGLFELQDQWSVIFAPHAEENLLIGVSFTLADTD